MSVLSTCTTATSMCFVDLATFAEVDGFQYGGPNAITWFVASVQKANWFSFIPITLRFVSGTPDFAQRNVAASCNRSGDYILSIWFRALIPPIGLVITDTVLTVGAKIRWVENLMHNLFEKVQISFNELVVQEFDNYWLDNNFEFRIPGSKRVGYNNMIGNIGPMIIPVAQNQPLGTGGYFSCPLPFWFAQDSGLALPIAALPFNDVKVIYCFRNYTELVTINPGLGMVPATINNIQTWSGTSTTSTPTGQTPHLVDPQTFSHYAVVHNDERVKMGDAPRDILIRQIQEAQISAFKDVSTTSNFDLRFSHSVLALFWMADNYSWFDIGKGLYGREASNYTTEPIESAGLDPIIFTQLVYENSARLSMGSDYYSLTAPYYFSRAIPQETGYHAWFYALHTWKHTKPSGGTNYSKLANVSLIHQPSLAAVNASGITGPPVTQNGLPLVFPPNDTLPEALPFPQKWRHVCLALNANIVRVANGSLGFPAL